MTTLRPASPRRPRHGGSRARRPRSVIRGASAAVGLAVVLALTGCDRTPAPPESRLTRAEAQTRYARDLPAILAALSDGTGATWADERYQKAAPQMWKGECRVGLTSGHRLGAGVLDRDDGQALDRVRRALRGHGDWIVVDDVSRTEAWRTVTAWERDGGRLRIRSEGGRSRTGFTTLFLDAALRPQECAR